MIELIKKFTSGYEYAIFVGTDSDVKDGEVIYATVLVVYRLGNGATYFYTVYKDGNRKDLYTRIFKEAEMSLEMAKFVEEILKLGKPVVHLDIGYEGLTKELVSSVIGYVKGMGYPYQVKPNSFAATKIAHKHTK
ncbi:ribonuclease H-like YkuK family protein [Thermotoga sp. KOL6]|uniref:ribonuclease H-like YkuK family protein n=1 Tax=Thermotoga sp. KOL6 TaxID=126741 RepID=UPI001E37151F|nr:ribonuclease H-like YkuK family protein [Thermotoga sp. KOL6]